MAGASDIAQTHPSQDTDVLLGGEAFALSTFRAWFTH
jgi:hypothetical protein